MTQLFKIGFGLSIASITMCLLVGEDEEER